MSPNTQPTDALLFESPPSDRWYLAYTKPRQEQIAHFNLEQQAFGVYLPLFKKFKKEFGSLAKDLESVYENDLLNKLMESQENDRCKYSNSNNY